MQDRVFVFFDTYNHFCLLLPGRLGGAADSLALPHTATRVRFMIKCPARQLFGEKHRKTSAK